MRLIILCLLLTACSQQPMRDVTPQATAPSPRVVPDYIASPKNKILNGAMRFDQNKRGSSYLAPHDAEIYSLDQWRICGGTSTDGKFSVQRMTTSAVGFEYDLTAIVLETHTQPNQVNFHIEYPIEGRYIKDLYLGTPQAEDMTISFYVYASTIGEYPLAMMNGTNDRSYVTSFHVLQANTWQKIVVTIPGDTQGTWSTSDWTFGIKLLWSLGTGSQHSTAVSEQWRGTAEWHKSGAISLVELPVGSFIKITGVQLEKGSQATSFDYINEAEELERLERYYRIDNGEVINSRLGGS